MHSIWSEFSHPPREPLRGHVKCDVLVIGGGMAGLLCAYQLKQAGVDCVVAEAARIGSGITANTTAKITSQHGLIYHKLAQKFGMETAGRYLQANEQALAGFRKLCREIPCDFEAQSSYVYSLSSRAELEAELRVLQQLRFPAAARDEIPLPFPTLGAVEFPEQAQFHPLRFLAAIAADLKIFENTPIRRIAEGNAIADTGTIHPKAIIVATHFPFLNRHGSYFLKLYQQRSYVLALKNADFPSGMYRDAAQKGLSFRHYGDTLLLGGGGHRTGKSGGSWPELEAVAGAYFPGAQFTHHWAAQDCMTLDGMPYIGRYSARTPDLYVATGFNKWGMTGSMAAAQILTDQLLGRSNPCGKLFSPSRSMLRPQLAANMLESTWNLLTPTRPRCPHLGCALKWNPQEHSWDCPCHGSRFAADGTLLDNPATGDSCSIKKSSSKE